MNKKNQVLTQLFEICQKRNDFVFDNELVLQVSKSKKFANQFDATKIDNKDKLPQILLDNDFAVIHLGSGKHQFIKGIDKIYHDFEEIQETVQWPYKKSLLNEYNSSESNILSVANNQRILHHFLFEKDSEFENVDISERPKTYFPHRTKTSFAYNFGSDLHLDFKKIQIEIDLTIEFKGTIGVFEGKNGKPNNFAIYQIYHPFLYYHKANQFSEIKGKIKQIFGVYVVKTIEKGITNLKIWSYTFENPLDITSIKFVKSICYQLSPPKIKYLIEKFGEIVSSNTRCSIISYKFSNDIVVKEMNVEETDTINISIPSKKKMHNYYLIQDTDYYLIEREAVWDLKKTKKFLKNDKTSYSFDKKDLLSIGQKLNSNDRPIQK